VRAAEPLPWSDLLRATVSEPRFNSIACWLPDDEAVAVRWAFDAEMARLYDVEDRRAGSACD
jgi:hypothetical protein